jgi:thioester reductase-like protein
MDNYIDLNTLKESIFDINLREEKLIKEMKIDVEDEVSDDIAIIGMACKFSEAEDLDQFWDVLKDGKECVRQLPKDRRTDIDKYYEYQGAKNVTYQKASYLNEIDKFDYEFFGISPKEAEIMDPNQRIFLENLWTLLEDSGYSPDMLRQSKTGVYVGVTGSSAEEYSKFLQRVEPDYGGFVLTGNLASIISSRLSYLIDLRGPSMLIDTACSSSLVALHLACKAVKNHECEKAIVGGININIVPNIEKKNSVKLGIESDDHRTKTFDDTSDGTNGGEGVASILIKPLKKALEDRDNIYAVIKGSAINQDGSSNGITAPSLKAQESVILEAWKNANIDPRKITYIEAHGTGTKLGDPIEIEAIKNAFDKYTNKKQFCAIGSVKTNIGHTSSLAGLAGVIKTVLSLKYKKIPASLNFKMPNRNINFVESALYVNDRVCKLQDKKEKHICGVSSFGISGTNCHVVIEEAPKREFDNRKESINILTISAQSIESFKELIQKYFRFINEKQELNLSDFFYTANTGRNAYKYRKAFVIENNEQLNEKIKQLLDADLREEDFEVIIPKELQALNNIAKDLLKRYLKNKEKNLLQELGKLYEKGANIDWHKIYIDECRNRISIPTYPFRKTRCWHELDEKENLYYKFIDNFKLLNPNVLPKEIYEQLQLDMNKYEQFLESKFKGANSKTDTIIKGRENDDYSKNEIRIAQVWKEVTGYAEVNIYDNFFEIGIDSIQASIFTGKLGKYFEVTLTDIYKYPTIESLSKNMKYSQNYLQDRLNNMKDAIKIRQELDNVNTVANNALEKEIIDYNEKNKKYDSVDLSDVKQYKNILLTGATGYLGMYMFRDLLENTNSNIFVLVRSSVNITAENRLSEKTKYYFDRNLVSEFKERVFVIDGELSKEKLGIKEEKVYFNLCNKIDCIIHSAANTNHFGKYEEFSSINVDATKNLVNFAKTGIKKDFNLISTMALLECKDSSSRLFSEYDEELRGVTESYYISTKKEAERIVLEAKKDGLNFKIFRVGNITFDSETGAFKTDMESNAFYLILKSFIRLGMVPDIPLGFDCSCVEYVSKSILVLFDKVNIKNEIFHINDPEGIDMRYMLTENKSSIDVKKVPIEEFFNYIYEKYDDENLAAYIQNLIIHLFESLSNEAKEVPIQVESNKTVKLLRRLDFSWGKLKKESFDNMFLYCKEVGFI